METTINKSEIFKSAWGAVKNLGMTLSQGLKWAWANAKEKLAKISKLIKLSTISFNEFIAKFGNDLLDASDEEAHEDFKLAYKSELKKITK